MKFFNRLSMPPEPQLHSSTYERNGKFQSRSIVGWNRGKPSGKLCNGHQGRHESSHRVNSLPTTISGCESTPQPLRIPKWGPSLKPPGTIETCDGRCTRGFVFGIRWAQLSD
uniref:Uncharacterized protein n=1 Tax=Physcomitrium patens TaxID=3218 RepID=A0A7I4EPD7_PHYPA